MNRLTIRATSKVVKKSYVPFKEICMSGKYRNYKTVARRLKHLRQTHDMTQRELSEKINLSRSSIGLYEREQSSPSIEIIVAYSDFFGVSCDWILKGVEYNDSERNEEL